MPVTSVANRCQFVRVMKPSNSYARVASLEGNLEFEKNGDELVSQIKLPEGDGCNLVVQFKKTATGHRTAEHTH